MSKPLSTLLVATFSVCFLVGIFGTLLAPSPFNVIAAIFGLISFALFIPIGRRADVQKEERKVTPNQWRIVVTGIAVLLVLMVGLAIWMGCMFARYRQIDVGLLAEWALGVAVMLFLRSVALKRLRALESEENG